MSKYVSYIISDEVNVIIFSCSCGIFVIFSHSSPFARLIINLAFEYNVLPVVILNVYVYSGLSPKYKFLLSFLE